MKRYDAPIIELIDFMDDVETTDIVVSSAIEKDDENFEIVDPW